MAGWLFCNIARRQGRALLIFCGTGYRIQILAAHNSSLHEILRPRRGERDITAKFAHQQVPFLIQSRLDFFDPDVRPRANYKGTVRRLWSLEAVFGQHQ